MTIAESLVPEFDQEMATTRKLLERVPSDRGTWKPHPKSFALGHLAQLVARMPGWLTAIVRDTEINLATYPGYSFETTPSLLAEFGASTFVSTTCRSRRCTAPPPMNADDGGDLPALAGVAQPLGDAVERRGEGGAHGAERRVVGRGVALAPQQSDLEQRQRIDVRVPQPDRRLEHGIVPHQVVALPDAEQRGDRAAKLLLQLFEQPQVAAQLAHVEPRDRE